MTWVDVFAEATPLLDYLQREAQDDFDSDGDDWESQEPQPVASPQKMSRREEMEMAMSALPKNKTTQELLQEIGRKNRGVSGVLIQPLVELRS